MVAPLLAATGFAARKSSIPPGSTSKSPRSSKISRLLRGALATIMQLRGAVQGGLYMYVDNSGITCRYTAVCAKFTL